MHMVAARLGFEKAMVDMVAARLGFVKAMVDMVAARLGFEKAMVGTGRATPYCMDRLRKHYSHIAEDWFLARKAAWALSGCMATDSADLVSSLDPTLSRGETVW